MAPEYLSKEETMSERVRVGIVGLGMVGTPVRRWFEEERGHRRGVDLFCYDTNPALGYFDEFRNGTVVFICVPTPPNPDGSCNTSIVESVVASIPDGRIAVIKSTVPPGTTEMLQKRHTGLKLMFCPEFLTESQAWADFIHPSRQLIGVTPQSQPHSIEVLRLLPQGMFQRPDAPVYGDRRVVTATEAEFAKYASNVFGAMKVAFANVMADVAWAHSLATGSEVRYDHIREMVAADMRIGPAWLDVDHGSYAGFGGYCFPKDLSAFLEYFRKILQANWKSESSDVNTMAPVLLAGVAFLQGVGNYNRELLRAQGLTVEEVSRHTAELALKRRPIRQRP